MYLFSPVIDHRYLGSLGCVVSTVYYCSCLDKSPDKRRSKGPWNTRVMKDKDRQSSPEFLANDHHASTTRRPGCGTNHTLSYMLHSSDLPIHYRRSISAKLNLCLARRGLEDPIISVLSSSSKSQNVFASCQRVCSVLLHLHAPVFGGIARHLVVLRAVQCKCKTCAQGQQGPPTWAPHEQPLSSYPP